jgi:ribokinase
MSKLVVLGSINADHVLQVTDFPRPGETVTGRGYRIVPGGKGANQAVAAARLGADIGFIARIGQDAIGAQMYTGFQQDGMDVQGVSIDPQLPTGIAIIYVADHGENSIGISPEANGALTPEVVEQFKPLLLAADTLLLQLEVPLETVAAAISLAHANQVKVVLNPAPARPLSAELLAQVDLITPNQTEAELLTGVPVNDAQSAAAAAAQFHALGIPEVMITMGKAGVWYSKRGVGKLVPGFRVQAVDTTAAGDTFNGALLAQLQRNDDMDAAIRFAHAAAAISVTRPGAQTSIPTRREVEQFLASHLHD